MAQQNVSIFAHTQHRSLSLHIADIHKLAIYVCNRKILQIGTQTILVVVLRKEETGFRKGAGGVQKVAVGVTNSLDSEQTAPNEQSDLDLHCLPTPIFLNTWNFYGTLFIYVMWQYKM